MNLEISMSMDAEMVLNKSQISLLRMHRILDRMTLKNTSLEKINKFDQCKKHVCHEESLNLLLKNTHLQHSEVLHKMTFHNLPKKIQKDLELLDEFVETDAQYLQDEVTLYEMFDGDTSLTDSNKNKLVGILYSRIYNERLREYMKGEEKDGFRVHASFAAISGSDILHKCADYLDITYDKENKFQFDTLLEDIEQYAVSKNTSMKNVIKPLLLRWIDDRLFVSEHEPLFMSDGKNTWNGPTKMSHDELFALWYKELKKSRIHLESLVDDGVITLKKVFHEMKGPIEVITGESMYFSRRKIPFIDDYKEQLELLTPLSNIFMFINEYSLPETQYTMLNDFVDLAKEFSQIFDVDMSEKYIEYREQYAEEVRLINMSLEILMSNLQEYLYEYASLRYLIGIDNGGFTFDMTGNVKTKGVSQKYREELEKIGK